MANVQIILSNPKSVLPSTLYKNGYVQFDIYPKMELSESTSFDALINAFSNFQDNYVIASTLPKSGQNLLINEFYKGEIIPIICTVGGVPIGFKKMRIESLTESDTPDFEIQFISDNPFLGLKELKINQLDFGNFDFSLSNIQNLMQNDIDNLNVPFYLPVCHYGSFADTTTGTKSVKVKDLRVWFREYSILKKAFAKINWTFESKIHETTYGKRIGNYLSNSFTGSDILKEFSFKALTANNQTHQNISFTPFSFNIVFNDTEPTGYDKGVNTEGYFSNTSNAFTGLSGDYNLKFSIISKYELDSTPQPSFVNEIWYKVYKNGSGTPIAEHYTTATDKENVFILSLKDVQPSDYFQIGVGTTSFFGNIIVKKGSYIELEPQRVELKAGLFESLSKYIDPNYKFIEYFKGVTHPENGHFTIDYINRKVTMFPPYQINNIFDTGENVEGYYTGSQIDLRGAQIKRSEKYTYPSYSFDRYIKFMYKKSSDPYIGEKEPFSKRFDFGANFKENETIYENPFFEPTAQTNDHNLSSLKFPIAVCWDNKDGNLSQNINARRCIFENRLPSGAQTGVSFWQFEGNNQINYFPTCYMAAETTYNNEMVKFNLAYGLPTGEAWADLAFYINLYNQYNNGSFEALFDISPILRDKIDYRKLYIVFYEGNAKALKLSQMRDFKLTEYIPTPLNFFF